MTLIVQPEYVFPIDWKKGFNPSRDGVEESVEEIAENWIEHWCRDVQIAKTVAMLMPDPVGWFGRNVAVPEVPASIVKEIDSYIGEFDCDAGKECCGETIKWHWQYCPMCGKRTGTGSNTREILETAVSEMADRKAYEIGRISAIQQEKKS